MLSDALGISLIRAIRNWRRARALVRTGWRLATAAGEVSGAAQSFLNAQAASGALLQAAELRALSLVEGGTRVAQLETGLLHRGQHSWGSAILRLVPILGSGIAAYDFSIACFVNYLGI